MNHLTSVSSPSATTLPLSGVLRSIGRAVDIRAAVFLNGAQSEFGDGLGRSSLDLPIDSTITAIGLWRRHLLESQLLEVPHGVDFRFICSQSIRMPNGIEPDDPVWRCERDPVELRGTGGVLRDVTSSYPSDAFVLVIAAAQILMEPLEQLVAQLAAPAADISLLTHEDGSPCCMMLVRCGCLRDLPEVGFVDFKEQALPLIANHHSVFAVRSRTTVAASIRTAEQYIKALRRWHQSHSGDGPQQLSTCRNVPFAEDWAPAFQIAERAAVVEGGAKIHDSVVLAGAHVGRNATLVRTVVGPGAVVGRDALLIDQLVTRRGSDGRHHSKSNR